MLMFGMTPSQLFGGTTITESTTMERDRRSNPGRDQMSPQATRVM
jgi:hypothetical protein